MANCKSSLRKFALGFDVNKPIKDNWTPLLLAASVGAPEVTTLLIENGADVNIHRGI